MEKRQEIAVFLGEGFPRPGVHQFSDGVTPQGVIKMTGPTLSPALLKNPLLTLPLADGEALDVVVSESQVTELIRFWMPSAQRMALDIPLHPDRMVLADWEALPGIGPRMAQTIEEERQRNGDFGSLAGLGRVKGIGPKRLAAWKRFFREVD